MHHQQAVARGRLFRRLAVVFVALFALLGRPAHGEEPETDPEPAAALLEADPRRPVAAGGATAQPQAQYAPKAQLSRVVLTAREPEQ